MLHSDFTVPLLLGIWGTAASIELSASESRDLTHGRGMSVLQVASACNYFVSMRGCATDTMDQINTPQATHSTIEIHYNHAPLQVCLLLLWFTALVQELVQVWDHSMLQCAPAFSCQGWSPPPTPGLSHSVQSNYSCSEFPWRSAFKTHSKYAWLLLSSQHAPFISRFVIGANFSKSDGFTNHAFFLLFAHGGSPSCLASRCFWPWPACIPALLQLRGTGDYQGYFYSGLLS